MKNNIKNLAVVVLIVLLGLCVNASEQESSSSITEAQNENVQAELKTVKANKSTLDKAQELINNKDFKTAIMYLNSYISSKPKKYEAYKLRGDAYYELRQYALAQKDYQSAVDIKMSEDKFMTSTKYISAVVLGADKNEQLQNAELGDLYARLMYAQKAQNNPAYATSYENAVKYNSHIYLPRPKKTEVARINCPQKYGKEINPSGIDKEIYGAIDDIEKEDYNSAIFKAQKVVQAYPDYYLGQYLYGVALAGLEKADEAIVAFNKSIELNSYDFESYASLGQLYYLKAETNFSAIDSKKSVEYFKKALKLNPDCYLYYFYIGLNELQLNNTDLAIENFDRALALNAEDYNSMYYKLIAQYINHDFSAVIKGTTNLLYKHVSNYNSVLYLRALAYSQVEKYDEALTDLNSIQNNIQDIYNADIKVVTDRDRALESYIYYLKMQIAHVNGSGAASDKDKAMQNPIIAQLSKIESAMKPYKNILKNDKITLADYKKFESFYNTSLPKILQSGIVISESDVENQYDYIRTVFEDLGLTFKYLNPDYKLSTIENFPYKKYASKLSVDDLEKVSSSITIEEKSLLRPKTVVMQEQSSQKDIIGDENQSSLAKMLASNELVNRFLPVVDSDLKDSEKYKEYKEDKSSNIASGEPFVYIDKDSPLVDKKNSKEVKEILKEESEIKDSYVPESGNDLKQEDEIVKASDESINSESVSLVQETEKNIKDFAEKENNSLSVEKKSESVFDDKGKNKLTKEEKQAKKDFEKALKEKEKQIKFQEKFDAKVQEEQEKIRQEIQKSESKAKEQAKAQEAKAVAQAQKEQMKYEREQARADVELKKAELKAQALIQKEQLKAQREEAKAELKAKKEQAKQQKKLEKQELRLRKKQNKKEKNDSKAEIKTGFNRFINLFKAPESTSSTGKTVIKSLPKE